MSAYRPTISGRKARRAAHFAQRRKGAGWTRPFRKGREQRTPETADQNIETLTAPYEGDEENHGDWIARIQGEQGGPLGHPERQPD